MKFHLMAKISEHPDNPATTHLGHPNICINNSRGLANRYAIDKRDIKPAVMKQWGRGGGVRLSYQS